MAYDIEEMLMLLLSIKHSTFSEFVVQHLSYKTVGDLCIEALEKGFIIETRKNFHLTEDGYNFIEKMNNKLGRKGIDRQIAHLPDVTIENINLDDIYLPKKI